MIISYLLYWQLKKDKGVVKQIEGRKCMCKEEKASGKKEIRDTERKKYVKESNDRSSQRTGRRAHTEKMILRRIDHLSQSTI